MSSAGSVLILTATSLIAASGACLAIRLRKIALRLFCAGVAMAAASALTQAHIGSAAADRLAVLAALAVTAGLCAILIFNARRWAHYLIWVGAAGWVIASTFNKEIDWLGGHWWIVPIALLVPCAAAFIAEAWAHSVRDRVRRPNQASAARRFLRWMFLGRARRGSRRRIRHIGDIGTTKRQSAWWRTKHDLSVTLRK